MRPSRSWSWVAVLLIGWLIVTAGVAFLVARATDSSSQRDITTALPTVSLDQRATVGLSDQLIAPVISGDAMVVPDGDIPGSWLLEAPVSAADLAYRLLDPPAGVRALITGGPSGFACPWAGIGQDASGAVTMRCRVPADVRVAAGLTGLLVLQLSSPVSVPSLPVTAVIGSAGQGQVLVVGTDRSLSVRDVTLGISDEFSIAITGGLDPEELVLEVPTQADLTRAST